ncbi:hypothetical protein D3C73_1473740 [compost metagenome]
MRALTLQFEHQAPGLDQAFAAMLPDQGRFAGRAHEGITNLIFVALCKVKLGQDLAQVGVCDADHQCLAFAFVRCADVHLHEIQAQ